MVVGAATTADGSPDRLYFLGSSPRALEVVPMTPLIPVLLCAWLLWVESKHYLLDRTTWEIVDTYLSREVCQRGLEARLVRRKDDGPEWKVLHYTVLRQFDSSTFLCVPDTFDPRPRP